MYFTPFKNIRHSTFILLIVNISVAADAFYKYIFFIVIIWRLNLTGNTFFGKITERRKSQSVRYRAHKYAHNW